MDKVPVDNCTCTNSIVTIVSRNQSLCFLPSCSPPFPSISSNSKSNSTIISIHPILLILYQRLSLDPSNPTLSPDEKSTLLANIQLLRDAIVLFTASGAARGVSGHTGMHPSSSLYPTFYPFFIGGAYDTVPEVCLLLALFNHSEKFHPVVFDEAGMFFCPSYIAHFCLTCFTGHRVATQYLLSALEGSLPAEQLMHYREANSKLPGHPELGLTPGVKFSSGRLGHMWYVFLIDPFVTNPPTPTGPW